MSFIANWQCELYPESHFSDSDEPGDDFNPFRRNTPLKRAKARQHAASRRRAREKALWKVKEGAGAIPTPQRPGTAHPLHKAEKTNATPPADTREEAKDEEGKEKRGEEVDVLESGGDRKALRHGGGGSFLDAETRKQRAEEKRQRDLAERERAEREQQERLDQHVREATGSPCRKLDGAAARRIQKYIEAESPSLRKSIEDQLSRPTDLVAFHAARREAKRRARRHRETRRSLKKALRATMASARMMTRASAIGTAKSKHVEGKGPHEAEEVEAGLEAPRRLHSGGLRAAMTTLMAQAKFMNLRLKLPSVADALGEDPDDPMTTQDLDAPIGSPKPNVWIPDGANEDRPEFSSDDTGSDDGGNDGGGGGGQNVDDGGSDDGGASPQSESLDASAATRMQGLWGGARKPSFVQPRWRPIRSVQHSYGAARSTKPHQGDYYDMSAKRLPTSFPYYGASTTMSAPRPRTQGGGGGSTATTIKSSTFRASVLRSLSSRSSKRT